MRTSKPAGRKKPSFKGGKKRPPGSRGSRPFRKRGKRALPSLDYKNSELLMKYVTEKGKILPRKVTRLSAKDQRELTRTIKRARHAGVLPFQAS